MKTPFYELQVEIENSCLLNCIHCSSLATRLAGKRAFSDEALLRFLELFSGQAHIYFTGGEPLLYKDLLCLCDTITYSHPEFHIGLYTTGNCSGGIPISTALATSLKQAGVVDCYFSIYHFSSEQHDKWTNYRGSFNNTILSIKNVADAGIIPKAHVVINSANCSELNDIIKCSETIGVKEIRFLKLSKSGAAITHWDEIGLSTSFQNSIIEQLIAKANSNCVRLSFSGYPELHPCRSFKTSTGCQAGTNLLYIDSNGDIYPCACTKRSPETFKIGNITDLPVIKQYLNSQKNVTHYDHCLNDITYISKQ